LVADDYLASLEGIQPRSPSSGTNTKFFSSVTGLEIDPAELGPSYWVRNLVSTVQFGDALRSMCFTLNEAVSSQQESIMLIEVGPHGALEGPVKQTLKAAASAATTLSGVQYTPSLVRNI